MIKMKGIRLIEPQGKYIIEDKKKMVILSEKPPKDFYNTDIAIIEDEEILGTLQLRGEAGPLKPGSVRSPLRDLHGLTDEDWDERVGKDPKFNQSVYTITFEDVKPWDEPVPYDKSETKGEYWLSDIEKLEGYSRFKCMSCDSPPTVEVLWTKGKARAWLRAEDETHAWFCAACYEKWKQEDEIHQINDEREIDGEASETWEESLSEEKTEEEEENLEGATTSDDVLREEPEVLEEGLTPEIPEMKSESPEVLDQIEVPIGEEEPIPDDEISKFIEPIMAHLESELRKMAENELKRLAKKTTLVSIVVVT